MSIEHDSRPAETGMQDALVEVLSSRQNVTITVRGEDGTAIRSGSHIVRMDTYERATTGSDHGNVEWDTVLCLVAEDEGAPDVEAALARLFEVAFRHSGQSRVVAQFLLAWWNGSTFGGFVISDLFRLDADLAADAATVFTHLSRRSTAAYVDAYGFGKEMRQLAERYLPCED